MHKLQINAWLVVSVGGTKKRGVRVTCGWKHFFVLIFLLLFVSRQKVKALEVIIS